MARDTRPLFDKYMVIRTDGKDRPGEKHESCRYFVLDLDHDEAAHVALAAYAEAVHKTRPALAADIRRFYADAVRRAIAEGEGR